MRKLICHLSVILICCGWALPSLGQDADESLPAGFRFVGNYKFEKRVKIKEGKPFTVASKAFVCRAYTDGISIRLYGTGGSEGYTSFSIYRNDGVLVRTGSSKVETVPGVQAHTMVGDVVRQLTMTEQRLVLTKFPALSDVVEVTYANRIISISRND